jgi:hypothetical protein
MRFKSILLLLIFLFLKLGIGHSLSHEFSHQETEDCQECVLITESNIKYGFDNSSSDFDNVSQKRILPKSTTFLYHNPIVKETFQIYLFNKPPPVLI